MHLDLTIALISEIDDLIDIIFFMLIHIQEMFMSCVNLLMLVMPVMIDKRLIDAHHTFTNVPVIWLWSLSLSAFIYLRISDVLPV